MSVLTDREQQVLDSLRQHPERSRLLAIVAGLNCDHPCPWCPVGPAKWGRKHVLVPWSSRLAMRSVLDDLLRSGMVAHAQISGKWWQWRIAGGSNGELQQIDR